MFDDLVDLREGLSDLGGGLSDAVVLLHSRGGLFDDLVNLRGGLSDLGGDLSDAVFLPHSRGGLFDDLVDLRGGLSEGVHLPMGGDLVHLMDMDTPEDSLDSDDVGLG